MIVFLTLFIAKTSSDIGKCGNLFQKNFDICKNDKVFKDTDDSDKGFSIRSDCATMAAFAMPVGWKDYKAKDVKFAYYTTHDPLILPEKDKLDGRTGCMTDPVKINDVKKGGNYQKFHKWCPMYDFNLRQNDEIFQNRKTCCNHASDEAFKKIDATYVAGNFEIFQKHNLYQIYPKCYDLLRYMPCMVCDPRVQEDNYTFIVGYYQPDHYTEKVPYYTYRLCDYYATEIWNQCRRAFFLTNGRKLVVPEDMGLEQFKNMVGVPSYHNLPNDKCFNISDVNPFY